MRTNEWNRWWRLPQQLRFLAAGAFNTGFGYAAFSVLYLLCGRWVHYLVIGLAAHVVAAAVAFLVYRNLVFPSAEPWRPAFVRFNASLLAGLAFGSASLYGLVEFGHWGPLPAQAAVIAASVVVNYLLHRYFSFRRRDGVT